MSLELTQEFDSPLKNEFWVQKIKQIEKTDRNFDCQISKFSEFKKIQKSQKITLNKLIATGTHSGIRFSTQKSILGTKNKAN